MACEAPPPVSREGANVRALRPLSAAPNALVNNPAARAYDPLGDGPAAPRRKSGVQRRTVLKTTRPLGRTTRDRIVRHAACSTSEGAFREESVRGSAIAVVA